MKQLFCLSFKDDASKIDFFANRIETIFTRMSKGEVIRKEYSDGKDTLIQKIKFEFPDVGTMYSRSSYFTHDGRLVIRVYTFSLGEDHNKQTDTFFKTLRYNLENSN